MPLENDKAGGFKFALGEELRSGIFPDLYASLVPLWEDGTNVRFTDVGVQKAGGYQTLLTTSAAAPIRGVLQVIEDNTFVVYFGDTGSLYRGLMTEGSYETLNSGFALLEDAGAASWDAGASTWDSGATLWDVGAADAEHWSLVNYGSFILATSPNAGPHIKKDTGPFQLMPGGVTMGIINSGGTGYAVDDVLTFVGSGAGATCKVTSAESGVITGIEMVTPGTGWTAAPTSVTGGSGSGADIVGTFCDLDVNTVKIFQTRGPHVIGFNTSRDGREFLWCDADDPDTWLDVPSNLAGSLTIREMQSDIIAAVPLGNRIAVYGEDQMFLVNYLGNELVFGYTPALNGVGAVSVNSIVPVGPANYGLSSQGFFVTDGSQIKWLDQGKVRHWFEQNVSSAQISKCCAHHNENRREVLWSFPTDTLQATTTIAFNYELGTWTFYGQGLSAGQERTVAQYPLVGTETGDLQFPGASSNANLSALTAYVRTKPVDLGDSDRIKELSSIRVGYRGTGLQYRVGWSETEDGTVNWGAYTDVADGFAFHNLRTAGRYLHLEFYSAAMNVDWHLMSVELQGRTEGTR